MSGYLLGGGGKARSLGEELELQQNAESCAWIEFSLDDLDQLFSRFVCLFNPPIDTGLLSFGSTSLGDVPLNKPDFVPPLK